MLTGTRDNVTTERVNRLYLQAIETMLRIAFNPDFSTDEKLALVDRVERDTQDEIEEERIYG